MRRITSFVVIAVAMSAAAAESPTSTEAYAEFTRLKEVARARMWPAGPDRRLRREDCEAANSASDAALMYLERPDVRTLVLGTHQLVDSRVDIWTDQAQCAMALGDQDRAVRLLEQSFDSVGNRGFLVSVLADEIFAPLKDDARIVALQSRARRIDAFWNESAFSGDDDDPMTVEKKVAGLSAFWAEVRHGFAYIDRVDFDWNATYLEYLHRVIATDSVEDYYRVLMQLAPLLKDGHTNVYPPERLQRRFFAAPPIRTTRVDGRVLVTWVGSASLANHVRAGDEIVAIDGMPTARYADEFVKPFASASTPQDLEIRMFDYQLLQGAYDRPVRLTVQTPTGLRNEWKVSRSGYNDRIDRPASIFRVIEGVAYFPIDSFESDAIVRTLDVHWTEITTAKGLIIDIRNNGGGNSDVGIAILSRLIRGPIPLGRSTMRSEPSFERAFGPRWTWVPTRGGDSIERSGGPIFDGPVALLIGPRTFSAAEDFAMQFDALDRGPLYGSATAGSTGQPLTIRLPGGGSARVCVRREAYPNGKEFVGVGIQPTVAVAQTIADVRADRDVVLARAVSDLQALRH